MLVEILVVCVGLIILSVGIGASIASLTRRF